MEPFVVAQTVETPVRITVTQLFAATPVTCTVGSPFAPREAFQVFRSSIVGFMLKFDLVFAHFLPIDGIDDESS